MPDCAICDSTAECHAQGSMRIFSCPRCGNYQASGDDWLPDDWLPVKAPEHRVRLSGWVREQNAAGIVPVRITPEISRRVAGM